jgi:hypothetical protein
MDQTFKKLDSIIRGGFSPDSTSTLDGIGYTFTMSEMRSNSADSYYKTEIRHRKKFDPDDELCTCADPCDEVNQVKIKDLIKNLSFLLSLCSTISFTP